MSRKIKYRVWDNENKSYNDPYSYAYYALTQDGRLDFYCHGDRMDEADPDVYFIEQYTGLTDKNGQEIYEGDIVGIYQEYSDKEGSKTWEELEPWGQVTYEDSRARFGIWGDSPYEGEDRHFFDLIEGLEVIGNIHENKELLDGSD